MKQLVVYKEDMPCADVQYLQKTTEVIVGININFALIETDDLYFDESIDENRSKVLIRILAVSSNYRDIALILIANNAVRQGGYLSFGSEFVGLVLKKGSDVTNLNVGDKVIADNNYPEFAGDNLPGIPSNAAFKEYEILKSNKLIKVPDNMPDHVAAGFSIGAQTAYAMVDKLAVSTGNVLVTGIKSNTSLFALNILKNHNVNVYGTSSNLKYESQLTDMGLTKLIKIPSYQDIDYKLLPDVERVMSVGGFDYIIDPFSDMNMFKCLEIMNVQGKYITCGIHNQFRVSEQTINNYAFTEIISKNLTIMGNCLGKTSHLNKAINDFTDGALHVHIAKVFTVADDIKEFIHLSYAAAEKVPGKIVFSFKQ